MAETRYLLPVWSDTRIRHHHRTEKRRVVGFSLQLEVEVGGTWREVIRYDTAHGFAHIDRFTLTGKRGRERLEFEYAEALTRAERDLKRGWPAYRDRFLKGELP